MRRVVLAVLVVAAATAWSFRLDAAGTTGFWIGLGVPYLALTALALYRMWDDGTLIDKLVPRWGDLSIGAVTAALLLMASWATRSALAPAGTPRFLWLLRVYAQVGNPETIQRSMLLTTVVLLIALMEEITWRGMVLTELENRFGERWGWPLAALAYGAAQLPTLIALAAPGAGLNPLLVTAALGAGIVWSFTARLTKRLPPVMFSHMAFIYFTAVQFRLPGL
jgi:membrane protease YdiL (CAAX protease family)